MSCLLFGKVGGGTAAPGLEGGERLLGGKVNNNNIKITIPIRIYCPKRYLAISK